MSLFRSELLPGVTGVTARRNGDRLPDWPALLDVPDSSKRRRLGSYGCTPVRPIGVATFSRRLDLRVGARPRGPGLGPRVLASISSVRRGQLELRLWTVREAREGREDGRQENELGDDDEGDCAVHWSPPP
jgi:hypothetical protein